MKRTPLRKVSKRRQREGAIYREKVKAFLKAHPYCQHWLAEHGVSEGLALDNQGVVMIGSGWAEAPRSAEVHHKRGRGKYYLDESTWMACRPGHATYIHLDPKRYEKGYCLPR